MSEAVSVGMCYYSGREEKGTEEADKMESGSFRDGFWSPQSDPEHDIAPGARLTVLKYSRRCICKFRLHNTHII